MLLKALVVYICFAYVHLFSADMEVCLSVNGITPSFLLVPDEVSKDGGWTVRITFRNNVNQDREITIFSDFIQHVVPLDEGGKRLPYIDGARSSESADEVLKVPSNSSIVIEKHFSLKSFYDISKIKSLSLWYDLRLAGIDPKSTPEWRVPWISVFLPLPK